MNLIAISMVVRLCLGMYILSHTEQLVKRDADDARTYCHITEPCQTIYNMISGCEGTKVLVDCICDLCTL